MKSSGFWISILSLAFVVIVWLLFPYILVGSQSLINIFYPDIRELAALGDSYNILSTLFSGLAFAGLISTIYMQSRQLNLQKEEMKLTRDEMKLTRDEHEKASASFNNQAKSLEQQLFAMKDDQTINGFNHLYNSLTVSLNAIESTYSRRDKDNVHWVPEHRYSGTEAIKRFISLSVSIQEKKKEGITNVVITEDILRMYLELHAIMAEWISDSQNVKLKSFFKLHLSGLHANQLKLIYDYRNSHFLFLEPIYIQKINRVLKIIKAD